MNKVLKRRHTKKMIHRNINELLENHLQSKIIHEKQFVHVMQELLQEKTEEQIDFANKEYLASFINKDSGTTLVPFEKAQEYLGASENSERVFEYHTEPFKILGLENSNDAPKVAEMLEFISAPGGQSQAIFRNSVDNFRDKVDSRNLEVYEESVHKTANFLYERVAHAKLDFTSLIACFKENELIWALCSHPFLFKIMTPVIFFSLALPLMCNLNLSTFFTSIAQRYNGFFLLSVIPAKYNALKQVSLEAFVSVHGTVEEKLSMGVPIIIEKPKPPIKNDCNPEDKNLKSQGRAYTIFRPMMQTIGLSLIGGAVLNFAVNFQWGVFLRPVIAPIITPIVTAGAKSVSTLAKSRNSGALVRDAIHGFFLGLTRGN
jgi:hypothetical protein